MKERGTGQNFVRLETICFGWSSFKHLSERFENTKTLFLCSKTNLHANVFLSHNILSFVYESLVKSIQNIKKYQFLYLKWIKTSFYLFKNVQFFWKKFDNCFVNMLELKIDKLNQSDWWFECIELKKIINWSDLINQEI